MTVYFINNNFKYETEAVLKIFCPLERFSFVYDEEPAKSRDMVIISVGDSLYVYADIGGVRRELWEELPEDKTAPGKGRPAAEVQLCRMLFTALSGITGVTPEWGCLTGVRPVKLVNSMISRGADMERVCRELREKYFVGRRKSELAYKTAVTQRPFLEGLSPECYSLYISIPFCPSRCAYCSFVSHSIESKSAAGLIPDYVNMLCREIKELGDILRGSNTVCRTVYIGGGTPTSLSAGQLEKIMGTIAENIDISQITEYNVEAGRPDTITREKLTVIKAAGATRISVNPQTMNDSVLAAIGRRHTAAQVEECFALARSAGFDNINMDTIAGLPTDTPEGFRGTLGRLLELSPESITVHTLTVKRSSRLSGNAGDIKRNFLDSEELREMVDFSFECLTGEGYLPYYLYRQKNTVGNLENVGYSKPGYEGLYNIYIMEEAQNILACGAGASTKLIDSASGKITRFFNYKYPYEYISGYDKMTEYKSEIGRFAEKFR